MLAPPAFHDRERFGHFDDSTREYVVETPYTPYPWINYLGNNDFRSLISHTGGGYQFYRDAKLRRLTRYRYNSVPRDQNGRLLYLRDDTQLWSPTWQPCQTPLDHFECRHGLGYTRFHARYADIDSNLLCFVPRDAACEIQQLTLTNGGPRRRHLQLFAGLEWCLWNAHDDANNFQRNFSTGEVLVDGGSICHLTEYRERRNHFAFFSVNSDPVGFDTDRDSFLGPYGSYQKPRAVQQGACRQTNAFGWAPAAVFQLAMTLEPGESRELVFLTGYVENEPERKWTPSGTVNLERMHQMQTRFADSNAVATAFAAVQHHWEGYLDHCTVQTEEPRLDRLANIWAPYQCAVTHQLSRSASLFESGVSRGMGFRDSNQDLLGIVGTQPDQARQRILDLAAVQFRDGGAYHQYQPLTKQGNADIGGGFNDDPLWLILSTGAYLKETGDSGILHEAVPFADESPGLGTTLFDHLRASFQHVVDNLGPHGLPLIGRADWNDCLNLNCFSSNPDEAFQTTDIREQGVAESLMIAGLFLFVAPDYQHMCRLVDRDDLAAAAGAHRNAITAAVDKHGWDGRWFLRAYRHDGGKVGSSENREGQIFIESQAWCVMAGVGHKDGRAERALDSVRALLTCEHGVVLVYPAYTQYDPALGEISSYPPGYKENGAVFCHTNPWIVIAETMLGRGEHAFQTFCKTAPTWRESQAKRHKTEPYVYAQMIAGKEAAVPGEAKNSWLTGTAAWSYHALTHYILGVRPDYDGLRIDPCIPPSWPGFEVTRRFRGTEYHIKVHNPNHVTKGVARMTVNGTELDGNLLPPGGVGDSVQVVVTMGHVG
ncbi:CBM-X domain-containing protein [Acanthopleuribacter pedis]